MRTPIGARRPFVLYLAILAASLAFVYVASVGVAALAADDKQAKDKSAKDDDKDKDKDKDEAKRRRPRLIGDVTAVDGLQPYVVEGVGLIVGLDETGCDPAPGPERSALEQEMLKRPGISKPDEILRSPRTALVRIRARIPPGVRSCKTAGCWCRSDLKKSRTAESRQHGRPHLGDTFDIEVEVPARDTTTSLKGGWMLEAWLTEVQSLRGVGPIAGHVRGRAEGPVLVSAGLDHASTNPAELRRGRILGGGIAHDDREFALITEGDRTARWTILVAARINERFPGRNREGKQLAEAKNNNLIAVKIPSRYRQNIPRYLEVVRNMPVSQTPNDEAERMRWWGEELLDPKTARSAAIRLEGIGIRAINTLKKGLDSSDPDVRFFAAESLAYLDEPIAAAALDEAARDIPEYRAHALTALGSLDEPVSRTRLTELIRNSDSFDLRYGAFRALQVLEPNDPAIPGIVVDDQFRLNQVASTGRPFVHVSSRERAEIVLFGQRLKLETPLFLKVGNSIVLSANRNSAEVQISRFEPGRPTRRKACGLELADVIREVVDMGATYPDVVGLMVNADTHHNLPGRLELDALPDPTRLATRLNRLYGADEMPQDVSMPNLFRWFDNKKPRDKDRMADSDATAIKVDNDADDLNKPAKPSLMDRIFRRSAN
jgi:flagellar basal body P-ring protein FlgI